MTETIKCSLYDHFEIACMRRSQLSLELKSGEVLTGVATNLITQEGKEFLLLKVGDVTRDINLMEIDILEFANSGERISIS